MYPSGVVQLLLGRAVRRAPAPPVYVSPYLLLALHNQTDRAGVPAHLPCLRAKHQGLFLMNEVAISYSSVKRVCVSMCMRERGRAG